PRHRVLEALRTRKPGARQQGITRVIECETRIVLTQRRRGCCVGATPHENLIVTILRSDFSLVEPLERTVMALVETPGMSHRQPQRIELFEDQVERFDR